MADGTADHRRTAQRYSRRTLAKTGSAAAAFGLTVLTGCSQTRQTGRSGSSAASTNSAAQTAGGEPQTGGVLRQALQTNPSTFDSQRSFSLYTWDAVGGIMSRPFRFKTGPDPKVAEDHDIENDLAVSLESPDAQTWTLKLRPDAKFHNVAPVNGHPLEAEDVRATFKRAIDPKNPSTGQLSMIDPDQIETPAKDTVVFKLKYPYSPFPRKLASPIYAWIYPREALAGDYDPAKQVIGSGPFMLDNYTPDVAFVLKKNPGWFEKGRPYVDAIQMPIISDKSQEMAQFTAGNLDTLSPNPNDLDAAKRNNPSATLLNAWSIGGRAIYFQLGDPASPFQDIRVRRAVSLALDRPSLIKALQNNNGAMQFSVSLAMGKWALRPEELDSDTAQYYTYNLDLAKRLLTEAGAANLQVKFLYATSFLGPQFEAYGQAVYNMLAALPWKITLVKVDYQSEFLAKGIRYGNYPGDTMVFSGVPSDPEVDEVIYNTFASQSQTNYERLHDSALDSMLQKARAIVNEDERLKAYKDIQKYVAQNVYTGAMPNQYTYVLTQPRVRNYCYTPTYAFGTETAAKLWIQK